MAVAPPRSTDERQGSAGEPPARRPGALGPVFWVPIGIAAAFVAAGVLATDAFNEALRTVVGEIITNLGWFLLLIVAGFLAFVVVLAVSRFGAVRLGGPDARPAFSTSSWFSMLFQAGMGIGLVFWAVSEPLLHFRTPPLGQAEPLSGGAADLALVYAFFHWTLHPWAISAVVGLAVGYFGARGLRISAVLRPLLGDRVDGPVGQAVDVLAVTATLFGIARISRGRTIRQFVLGVLLAPSLFTMIWFAVFGAAGIDADTATGGQLSRAAGEDEAVALVQFLDAYALPLATSALAIFLVWIFFVAGADAGTIVLGSMSTGGGGDPPRRVRLVWGVVLAAVAAAILVAGGLDALQGAAIVAATPFAVLMVAIAWCLYRALARDHPARAPGEGA